MGKVYTGDVREESPAKRSGQEESAAEDGRGAAALPGAASGTARCRGPLAARVFGNA